MTRISVAQTMQNYKRVQSIQDAIGYGDKIPVSELVKKGTVAAGKQLFYVLRSMPVAMLLVMLLVMLVQKQRQLILKSEMHKMAKLYETD